MAPRFARLAGVKIGKNKHHLIAGCWCCSDLRARLTPAAGRRAIGPGL
jgi:hypothetical protein